MRDGLRLTGLGVDHAGERFLDDISLEIRPGESLCLIGASGGGKSLIAAAIAGLLPACMAARGAVHLGGEMRQAGDQAGLRALWDRQLCLLPQEPLAALAPLLRAEDQVRLGPPALSRSAARDWLARFGLDRRGGPALAGGIVGRDGAALAVGAGRAQPGRRAHLRRADQGARPGPARRGGGHAAGGARGRAGAAGHHA